jgi:hypothetical protein
LRRLTILKFENLEENRRNQKMKGYIPTMFLTLALMIGASSAFAGDGILIGNATGDGILIGNVADDPCAPTTDSKGGVIDIILGTFFNTKDGILIGNVAGDGILIGNVTQPPVNCGILIHN